MGQPGIQTEMVAGNCTMLRTWHSAWWTNVWWWFGWWWWCLQHLLQQDWCWKACSPCHLHGSWAYCVWRSSFWCLPSALPPWENYQWKGGCCQQLHSMVITPLERSWECMSDICMPRNKNLNCYMKRMNMMLIFHYQAPYVLIVKHVYNWFWFLWLTHQGFVRWRLRSSGGECRSSCGMNDSIFIVVTWGWLMQRSFCIILVYNWKLVHLDPFNPAQIVFVLDLYQCRSKKWRHY